MSTGIHRCLRIALLTISALLLAVCPLHLAATESSTRVERVLYTFTGGADGFDPQDGVIFDDAGNIYGTTKQGGAYGFGVVFKLTSDASHAWTQTVLHDFAGGNDGMNPEARLVFDSAGNLYGTTYGGGTGAAGTVFKLSPDGSGGWTYSVFFSFPSATESGFGPKAGLILDQNGNLYGTTNLGGLLRQPCGTVGCGVVFMLDSAGNETVLHQFQGGSDGAFPPGGLTFDAAGNLYGMTNRGGICEFDGGCGTIFKLSPAGNGQWTESIIHTFGAILDGGYPESDVSFDAAGNMYGTTSSAIFKLAPNDDGTWSETILHTFSYGNGGLHPNSVLLTAGGILYGTTFLGESPFAGSVFKMKPDETGNWVLKTLYSFTGQRDGAFVVTGLVARDGRLYGATSGGGTKKNTGVIFEVKP